MIRHHLVLQSALLLMLGCSSSHAVAPPPDVGPAAPDDDAPQDKYRKGKFSARHHQSLAQRCGHRCVYRQVANSRLALELAEGGEARADDEGELAERFRSIAGDTRHETAWHRTWKGSWEQRDERLTIRLEPDLTDCTRRTGDGQPEAVCEPAKLKLRCEPEKVVTRAKRRRDSELSWVCAPARVSKRPGLTPFPWVFGMETPLTMVDRGPTHAAERSYAQPRRKKPRGAPSRKP